MNNLHLLGKYGVVAPTPTDHQDKLRIAQKMKGCTNQLIFQTTNPTPIPKLFHEDIILGMFEKW